MGNVWSIFAADQQLFDKSAHLRYPSASDSDHDINSDGGGYSSKFAFYQALKQAVAHLEQTRTRQQLSANGSVAGSASQDAIDMASGDRAHVSFMLAHWPREIDVVYDHQDEFPFAITINRELNADFLTANTRSSHPVNRRLSVHDHSLQTQQQKQTRVPLLECSAPTSHEEAILHGLCTNKLSSSEAIHQAIEQLRNKLHTCEGSNNSSNSDTFLQVLAKYPRATRLFASQQLYARADVEQVFRLHMLHRNYAAAAHVAGKLAFSDDATCNEKKQQRLQVMTTLLQPALDESLGTRSITSTSNSHASASRACSSNLSFDLVMTNEATALLQCQRILETTLGVESLVGSSLIETLHKLVALHATHAAAFGLAVDTAEQFDVHPRQFSYAMIKGFAQTEQWQTLLVVTAAARPAIDYVSVVELLLDDDHVDVAHDLLALIDVVPHERDVILALLRAYHGAHISGDTSANGDRIEHDDEE